MSTVKERIALNLNAVKAIKNIGLDLALVDDVQKMLSDSNSKLKQADESWKAYQDYLTRADIPFKKMIGYYNLVGNVVSDSDSLMKKIELASKEIGVNPSSIKGYDALKQNSNTAKEISATISSFKDPSSFQ